MNAREPQHEGATRADLAALKTDLLRELATEEELARLDERIGHLATKEELARLDERMDHLATKEEIARLDAWLTWRIIIAMGVLTAIFSTIVAMLNRSPGG